MIGNPLKIRFLSVPVSPVVIRHSLHGQPGRRIDRISKTTSGPHRRTGTLQFVRPRVKSLLYQPTGMTQEKPRSRMRPHRAQQHLSLSVQCFYNTAHGGKKRIYLLVEKLSSTEVKNEILRCRVCNCLRCRMYG